MIAMHNTSTFKALLLPALLLSTPAFGQDSDLVDPDGIAETLAAEAIAASSEEAEAVEEGGKWDYALSLGANAARSSASNVPGVTEGATIATGLLLNGHANLSMGQSSWQNNLKIQHTQTRTPQIPQFYKSADQLTFDSTYLFRLPKLDKVGPYARFKLDTQLFPGHFINPNAVQVQAPEGYADNLPENGLLTPNENGVYEFRDLTSPFQPLTTRFSVGAFANPVEKKSITVKTKVGVGAQNISKGGLALSEIIAAEDRENDDPGVTDVYDLVIFNEIQGGLQAGGELGFDISGSLRENINYGVSALFFSPFAPESNLLDPYATDPETDLELYPDRRTNGMFLFNTNTDITGNLGIKLSRYASLDFALSVKRVPLVTTDWQVQSNVMLSFAFNLIDSSATEVEE